MAYNGFNVENYHDKLANMSKEELNALFEDKDKIKKMVTESPTIASLRSLKDQLTLNNRQKATSNLACEPELKTMKSDLIKAHNDFSSALKSYESYKKKIESLNGNFSLEMMLDLMRVANREEDEKATKLVNQFLEKEVSLNDFCQQILPLRTVYKTRNIKIDKLRELVQQQQRRGYHAI